MIIAQKENEPRKRYLVRVCIAFLSENAYSMGDIEYDDVQSDALCLADDLRIQFNIDDDE